MTNTELKQIPFEVFLKIAYYVDDVQTLRNLRQVSRSAKRALDHIKPLKMYQLTKLFVVIDNDSCKVYDNEIEARDVVDRIKYGPNLLLDTPDPSVIQVLRKDILNKK